MILMELKDEAENCPEINQNSKMEIPCSEITFLKIISTYKDFLHSILPVPGYRVY
jgi:hypothetical protein